MLLRVSLFLIEARERNVTQGYRKSCGCQGKKIKIQQAHEAMKKNGYQDNTAITSLQSTKISKNNTSGYRGVSWHKGMRKWYAEIRFQGKGYYLGHFDTPQEASEAYQKAKEELHGKYLHEHGLDFK